jgi:hypothetical protein
LSSPKRACEQQLFLASFVLEYLSPKKILARFLYMLAKLPKVVAKNKYFVRALGLVVFSILAEAISAEEMLERERTWLR